MRSVLCPRCSIVVQIKDLARNPDGGLDVCRLCRHEVATGADTLDKRLTRMLVTTKICDTKELAERVYKIRGYEKTLKKLKEMARERKV